MRIPAPALASDPPLQHVIQAAATGGVTSVEKCLVFCPDAIGGRQLRDNRPFFEPVLKAAPVQVTMLSVMPTVTPVCFASMFTGAAPAVHGIQKYEKIRLACDTIFDRLVAAGKRVAIVAVAGSSIDLIFRGRELDYFSEPYDTQVADRAAKLLLAGQHDFVVVYQQEFDDQLHQSTPASPGAIAALKRHIQCFTQLVNAAHAGWARHSRLVLFAPDHGAHVDPHSGRGAHGTDQPDDMRIVHFYGFARPRR